MSAERFLQGLTQALFLVIFITVAVRALRRPHRANVDAALFFGVVALIVAIGWLTAALDVGTNRLVGALSGSLLMALPYLLLRLLDDFADVPRLLMRVAEVGLLLAVLGLFLLPPLPASLTWLYVLYFFGLELYTATAFVRQSRRSGGVTRRRMQAVAVGSALLGMVILVAGLQAGAPRLEQVWSVLALLLGLGSGIGYYLGFATPALLRRAWQEPELRAFLGRAASLPRLPETDAIRRDLERGAAEALGAPNASIGLWDAQDLALHFGSNGDGEELSVPASEMIGGRAFAAQRPVFSASAARDDPAHAEVYERGNARAILAAPITAGANRLGVLTVYAPRAPIFADDDLVLVQLLADQAAVVLESRALIDEAARVQAREEATRLKDDFLAAAAHDLKTPLTTLMGQAQLLQRKAARQPDAPADTAGVQRIVQESRRLNGLVLELLEAARLEGELPAVAREPVDLVEVARETATALPWERHRFVLEGEESVGGRFNRGRIARLFQNLIENAIKYSPEGGDICVSVRREECDALIEVADAGIGIPPADLPYVFDRFHRARNVDERAYSGMGLGLFICRGIVEQHGGRIWVTSSPGEGSTFHVSLPLMEKDEG